MWDRFPHLPSYLYFLHTCARVAQRRFAHLSRVSARGRKSSRQRSTGVMLGEGVTKCVLHVFSFKITFSMYFLKKVRKHVVNMNAIF